MWEGCNRKCFSFRFNENSNAHNYYETSRFLTASEVYTYACYSWQRDPGNKYVTRFQIIFMSSLLFSADNYWLSVCVVRGANYELLWQVSVWNNTTWYQCRGSPSTQRSIWPIDILAETRTAKLLTSETPACTHVREGWLLMETCAHTQTQLNSFLHALFWCLWGHVNKAVVRTHNNSFFHWFRNQFSNTEEAYNIYSMYYIQLHIYTVLILQKQSSSSDFAKSNSLMKIWISAFKHMSSLNPANNFHIYHVPHSEGCWSYANSTVTLVTKCCAVAQLPLLPQLFFPFHCTLTEAHTHSYTHAFTHTCVPSEIWTESLPNKYICILHSEMIYKLKRLHSLPENKTRLTTNMFAANADKFKYREAPLHRFSKAKHTLCS